MTGGLNHKQVIDYIGSLRVSELHEFVEALKGELNIKDIPMFVPGSVPASAPAASAGEHSDEGGKTDFDLFLTVVGSNKIAVIKVVRACCPSLTLMDAKKQVENMDEPMFLKKGTKDEMAKLKSELEAIGASAEIR